MIITKLIGGLGNQMFQYAIARSLAEIKETTFKLDITGFKRYKLRKYELGHFNIIENFVNSREIEKIKQKKSSFLNFYKKLILSPDKHNHYYIEKKKFNYDPDLFQLSGNIYLEGYWQTERYFKNIEDLIHNDFEVKTKINERNHRLMKRIRNCDSVAIHVRRGDYVTSPHTSSFHGTTSLNYYNKSIKLVSERISEPNFFVFSDDPIWTKNNICTKFPTIYISHNGEEKVYEDLRLMSNCKHFIIANSSFSWWGAWLCQNPNKIVLAPKKWLREDINTKDLIPEEWQTV